MCRLPPRWLSGAVLVIGVLSMVLVCLAVPQPPTVTIAWDHDPGPFSYNVYETTNLNSLPLCWVLRTNVTDQAVQLPVEDQAHFFTVTCVNTNSGDESGFATK